MTNDFSKLKDSTLRNYVSLARKWGLLPKA
jgi:hypothetical protein